MPGFYAPDLKLILPELILVMLSLMMLIIGAFTKDKQLELPKRLSRYALLGLLCAAAVLIFQHSPGEKWVTFEGQIIQDDFIYFAKLLILLSAASALAISIPFLAKESIQSFEYAVLILLCSVAMLLMVEANDFLALFIAIEMQGLSLYILAALNREQTSSNEAALKYFILGALATCLYLYGVSLLYGFTGSTNIEVVESVVRSESNGSLPFALLIGMGFILAALSFKVSAVPFHMWVPDVYQGCSTPVTAFIAAAPKVAAMVVFLRLMMSPFLTLYGEWQSVVIFISFSSMVLGAFAALRQNNLKRLLAYSAIGQIGYVLLGVAAGNDEGIQAVFVYLTIYLVMIVGTFGCLLCLRGKTQEGVQTIEDLSGISILHPKIAFILAVFMFSMAGIPPLAGFFAKLYVFKAAISAGFFTLAVIGVLASVVASYYYLKIVKVMYFDAVPEAPEATYGQTLVLSLEPRIILNLALAIILFFFVYPNPVLELAQMASLALPN